MTRTRSGSYWNGVRKTRGRRCSTWAQLCTLEYGCTLASGGFDDVGWGSSRGFRECVVDLCGQRACPLGAAGGVAL